MCIEENYEVLEMVVEAAESMFENKKEMYRSSSEKVLFVIHKKIVKK